MFDLIAMPSSPLGILFGLDTGGHALRYEIPVSSNLPQDTAHQYLLLEAAQ